MANDNFMSTLVAQFIAAVDQDNVERLKQLLRRSPEYVYINKAEFTSICLSLYHRYHADPDFRSAAAFALWECGAPCDVAVPVSSLFGMLCDELPGVRWYAADYLAHCAARTVGKELDIHILRSIQHSEKQPDIVSLLGVLCSAIQNSD